ncbi:MAG: hypothetical protein MR443_00895 [Lachnospiraceae bacterium]|nr:hypothetical protein [Lachnospiraceae bacterium]
MEKREKEYTNLDQERIVTVSDLLKEILRRIGLVIILGIIVAALCCGYKYAKDSKAAKAANSEDTTTTIKLTDKEQTDVNNVIAVQDNMKEQQAYLDNSVLMQINAYDESRVTLQYRIITGDKQLSKDLLSAYDNYVTNGSLAQDMINHGIDMDLQYLTELLYFEKDSDKDEEDSDSTVITDTPALTFEIRVIHKNQKSCEELAAVIPECLSDFEQKLQESTGSHELNLVDQSYAEVVDQGLWTYKIDRVNSVVSMQERVDSLKEKLSADQVALVEKNLQKADKKDDAKKEVVKAHISKKYAVLGFGIGIILAILYIVISYIWRGTINNEKDVTYLYGVQLMGTLKGKNKKNALLRLGDKLRGKKPVDFSVEEAIVCADVTGYCSRNQIQKLLLLSSEEVTETAWIDTLVKKLREAGVEATVETDILSSAAAREKAAGYEVAVLIAQVRRSAYDTLEQELGFCQLQNIQIAGAIVTE